MEAREAAISCGLYGFQWGDGVCGRCGEIGEEDIQYVVSEAEVLLRMGDKFRLKMELFHVVVWGQWENGVMEF